MKKLRRALEKMRKSEKTRQALNAKAEAAADGESDNKMAKCLGGKTAINKAVTMADPMILQQFKEVLSRREIRICKDPQKELCSGLVDSQYPFCVRKGRHVLKFLVKDNAARDVFERTVNAFKDQCNAAAKGAKSLHLSCLSIATIFLRGPGRGPLLCVCGCTLPSCEQGSSWKGRRTIMESPNPSTAP